MKNIAILVYNVINDYYFTVVEGILSYFTDKKDVHAIIATVNVPHGNEQGFDYQYWSSVEILKSKDIDGIIVVTNSFIDKIGLETFTKELEDFANRPVISVSAKLDIKNSKYTCTVPDEAYEKVVEHLKEKHNKKKIAFLSASLHGSPESDERLEAFKSALKKYDLEFYPELVIPGDFTPGCAKDQMLARYKTKEDIDFDSVVCVNDYSAGGCLLAFQELGVKVPDEIALVGFDNTAFSLLTYPTLSSVDQDIPGNGRTVAEIMYRTLNGEKTADKNVLQCHPVYRQSCGCIDCKTHSTAFYDENIKYHEIDEATKQREQNIIIHSLETTQNLYNLLNLMDTRVGMKNISATIRNTMEVAKITSIIACFYSQTLSLEPEDNFSLPEEAEVLLYIDSRHDIEENCLPETGLKFNPWLNIVPEECKNTDAGTYFLLPLYLRERNYGYMLCRTENTDLSISSVHLKILTNILTQSYENSKEENKKIKLLDRAHDLNFQSKTDELTRVFNRRGFIDYGQRLVDLSASMGKLGVVFFCDLDGLKTINDTYGHKIGDLAIQTEAKVLKKAFRDSDLVGRLSGDEFGVVAPGFPIRKIEVLRERLIQLNKELSEEAGLPFTLSISIGPIEYTEENKDLLRLLTQADKNLYEEKKIKHGK